jgi:hypothetical protein
MNSTMKMGNAKQDVQSVPMCRTDPEIGDHFDHHAPRHIGLRIMFFGMVSHCSLSRRDPICACGARIAVGRSDIGCSPLVASG